MSKENKESSGILREINQGFRYFTANYKAAVKNGADIAKKEIIEAVENRDQPVDIVLRKLLEAIMMGVQYAGEQLLNSGVDIVEQIKAKLKKK